MLRRAAVPRRLSVYTAALQRSSGLQAPSSCRHISLWRNRWRQQPHQHGLPVYFPRPQPTWKRMLASSGGRVMRGVVAFLVIYTCYEIYKEAVLIPLLAWADEEYESLSEKEKAELEKLSEEDPGIFLPCPFTERKIEQPPYKKSDPEWPFLMKARDPKVQKQLSEEICRVVVRYCSSHPSFSRFFGSEKNLKIGKVWLEFAIPARPPAKPYISGLIIDDDGIFWGERPIDPKSSSLLNKAVYPKAMMLAARDFGYATYIILQDDVRRYFGATQKPSQESMRQPMIVAMPGQGREPVSDRAFRPGRPIKFPEGRDTLSSRFWLAFMYSAARFQRNRQVRQPIRRGCFELEGVARIESKTKAATVAIHAWYDPQQRKFVDAWIVPRRWRSKPK